MCISVVGLGKLGACMAACFAYKGYDVIGIDINDVIIDMINNKISPYKEPKLDEFLRTSGNRLLASKNYELAMKDSDISFLVLPTPSLENGEFSDKYLKESLSILANLLKYKENYHTFVIVSTVSPCTVEQSLIPHIEHISGKKNNSDFGVVYNPEFIALGSVINDFLNPDLVLIGENNKKDGDLVESIYRNVCDNEPYYARMSIVSAEITKISLNSFVTMKISFANFLGNICERVPGANVDDITKALGSDRRISPYYLKAGPPYGGPCFPRDNKAFSAFANRYGLDAKLAKATDEINNLQIELIVKKIMDNLPENRKVSIIGLSYKEGTPVIEESASIKIIERLLKENIIVYCYDQLVKFHLFNSDVIFCNDLFECINNADVIVISVKNNSIIQKLKESKNKKIINLWS